MELQRGHDSWRCKGVWPLGTYMLQIKVKCDLFNMYTKQGKPSVCIMKRFPDFRHRDFIVIT